MKKFIIVHGGYSLNFCINISNIVKITSLDGLNGPSYDYRTMIVLSTGETLKVTDKYDDIISYLEAWEI